MGSRIAVTAKFEMTDAVPGGLWLDESIPIAQLLEGDGTLDALQLTAGGSLANPMFLFRGDVPREEFSQDAAGLPATGVQAGRQAVHAGVPVRGVLLPPLARQFRQALSMPLIALGGINELASMEQAMDDGFAFVALGRALLREPDLVRTLARGSGPARCASTATSACRRSTRAPTACWSSRRAGRASA